jgi:hypothetical protein
MDSFISSNIDLMLEKMDVESRAASTDLKTPFFA